MTKKRLVYCVCMIVALLLESSFFPVFFSGHSGLSAVAMLSLTLVFVDGFLASIPWFILLGILCDFVSGFPVGMHVMAFVLVAYFASFLSKRFLVDMRGVGMVLVAFFVLAATVVTYFLFAFGNASTTAAISHFKASSFFIGYLWNLVMFVLWYRLIKWMKRYYYF